MSAKHILTLAAATLAFLASSPAWPQFHSPVPKHAHVRLLQAATSVTLAERARQVALHGGILGTCKGCATAKTRTLVRQVYARRFAPAGGYAVRTALCIVGAESGFNPGAISSTGDYSAAQMNRLSHERTHPEWYRPGRGFRYLIFDPAYSAGAMWSMSHHGTSFTPWTGTYGRGLCR